MRTISHLSNDCVNDFVTAVLQYINLINDIDKANRDNSVSELLVLLPMLLYLGQRLPDSGEDIDDGLLKKELTDQRYRSLATHLSSVFDQRNFYTSLWDPYDEKSIIGNSLSDDLADVYRDFYDPLIQFQQDTQQAKTSAIFEWRLGMTSSWHTARHIMSALLPLQVLIEHGFGKDAK
jgi:hypothetical protein